MKEKIQELINEGHNFTQIGKILGHTRNTISKKCKKYNINLEKLKTIKQAHPNLDFNFFENINSKDKSYWLGFLYADGYVLNNRLSIDLKDSDKIVLEKFCLITGANNNKIKNRNHKKGYKSVQLRITSKKFVSFLIKQGCVNKKSKNIRLPIFENDELNLSFLMGYFDGDGWGTFISSGSFEFLNDIKNLYNIDSDVKDKGYVFYINLKTKLKNKMKENYENSLERKRENFKNKNCKCGKKITLKSSLCDSCEKISRRKNKNRPSLDTLLVEIETTSYEKLGRKYGVTGNCIKKWIRNYGGIPPYKKRRNTQVV